MSTITCNALILAEDPNERAEAMAVGEAAASQHIEFRMSPSSAMWLKGMPLRRA